MPVTINGTTGIVNNATDLNYTGTLTGGTGVVNIGSGQFYKDASGNVGIGTSSPNTRLQLDIASGTAYSSSSNGNILRLSNTTANGYSGIMFTAEPSSGNAGTASINCFAPSSGDGVLAFSTRGGGTVAERARIDNSGNLLVGTSTHSGNIQTGTQAGITTNGTQYFWITRGVGGGSTMNIGRNSTAGTGAYVEWWYNNTNTGTITTNGSTTSYNTSSDYRLKENVQPLTGALQRVAALKPCTYVWKSSGATGEGFIAHELQEVVPEAVTGEKDAVNEDGSIKPQGIDTSFLVATLTAAIQELNAKVDAQAAEIAVLKGIKQ